MIHSNNILTYMEWNTKRGFGLVNEFIGYLYTRLVSTSNYSATANLHNLQIARAHAKVSQSAFTSRC
jgi:hypothetical protein